MLVRAEENVSGNRTPLRPILWSRPMERKHPVFLLWLTAALAASLPMLCQGQGTLKQGGSQARCAAGRKAASDTKQKIVDAMKNTGASKVDIDPCGSDLKVTQDVGGCTIRAVGGKVTTDCSGAGATPLSADEAKKAHYDALADQLKREHPEIPQNAVHKLFDYMQDHDVPNTQYAAVADFDRPSNERRLSIINMEDGSVESYLVAHGAGSGGLYATNFSDDPGSHESSLGIYETGPQYDGEHGRSLKLIGMESSNQDAESRAVVMHAADYVSDSYVASHGEVGRSWGCTAVDYRYRDHIMNELEGGAALLVYHSSPSGGDSALVASAP